MSSSRTVRRALERAAAKQSRKELRFSAAEAPQIEAVPASSGSADQQHPTVRLPMLSEAQTRLRSALLAENMLEQDHADRRESRREINRLNAQYSTGPKSGAGKATSSMNALKTGLTGRTVLLPNDDASAFEIHVARFVTEHKPVGDRESELVQSLADSRWRLNRIPSLESGIYALGRIQFADLFASYDDAVRAALIQAHTYLHFQKQLTNLALQEARLRRHFEKDLAELTRLQAERIRTAKNETTRSETPNRPLAAAAPSVVSAELGFEFSTSPQATLQSSAGEPESNESATDWETGVSAKQ